MTNLKELVMSSNGLYGTLPQLSALSGLEMLDVADNGGAGVMGQGAPFRFGARRRCRI